MAEITLAQAQAQLDAYLAAELAVLNGQEYTMQGRSLRRADLREIREGVKFWNQQVARRTRGGIKVIGATPV